MILFALLKYMWRYLWHDSAYIFRRYRPDPFLQAIADNDIEQIEIEEFFGTQPSAPQFHEAARLDDDGEMFERLIKDFDNSEKLYLCICYRQKRMLRELLEAGHGSLLTSRHLVSAAVAQIDFQIWPPRLPYLRRARSAYNTLPEEIFAVLVNEGGVDINTIMSGNGNRSLGLVALLNDLNMLSVILRLGFRTDNEQGTALLVNACARGDLTDMLKLIACGVDVSGESGIGMKPVEAAKDKTVMTILAIYGAQGAIIHKDALQWIDGYREKLAEMRRAFVMPAALDLCFGLQSLELPALLTLLILDELTAAARAAPFHYKWNIVTTVKHFREPKN